jgi:hypothetical protein
MRHASSRQNGRQDNAPLVKKIYIEAEMNRKWGKVGAKGLEPLTSRM